TLAQPAPRGPLLHRRNRLRYRPELSLRLATLGRAGTGGCPAAFRQLRKISPPPRGSAACPGTLDRADFLGRPAAGPVQRPGARLAALQSGRWTDRKSVV